MLDRAIAADLSKTILKSKSILLLGPRQTGKTTLLAQLTSVLMISLIQPRVRQKYEQDPSLLADEVEALQEAHSLPLVIVDEIQKVPLLMDVVQDLIDRKVAQFILTGSSARKLKRGQHVNLLPGRVIPMYMDPLNLQEIPEDQLTLEQLLNYGSLPEIVTTPDLGDKLELLNAYVSLYLEEEIRSEALVRNLAAFGQFLVLAASESGYTVNYSKLSQKIGVAHTTIMEYYQILVDCLVAHRVPAYTQSKSRHKLSKADRYLMFDLGVRRVAAREGDQPNLKQQGHLFEQLIGLELIHLTRSSSSRAQLYYWKDLNGPEVDWLLELEKQLIPIEVKYTDRPNLADAKHLRTFLSEYPAAQTGFIVCQVERKLKIHDNIYAIPWQALPNILP